MQNTYVEKGYKYGVLLFPDSSDKRIKEQLEKTKPVVNLPRKRELEVNVSTNTCRIIDYDQISGLTIKDVQDYKELLYDNKYLIFVMYDSIVIPKAEHAIVRYIGSIDTTRDKDMAVDEVIGNMLLNNELMSKEPYINNSNKKRALCFLEKYIYGDKTQTYNEAVIHTYSKTR